MPAGEGIDFAVEPALNAEKIRHFRYPAADSLLVRAQAFQAKGQLMPDLIGHQLIIRALHDKADAAALAAAIERLQGGAVE